MIKILVNSYTGDGCGKFRVNDPHQPWEVTPQTLSEEDIYYYEHINTKPGESHWSRQILNEYYKLKK